MKRAILLLFVPLIAFADPGSAMQYLMKEPANLMDLGLVRLDLSLAELRETMVDSIDSVAKTSLRGFSFSSVYESDDDSISVRLWILPEDSSQAEAACRNLLPVVRNLVEHRVRTSFGHVTSLPSDSDAEAKRSVLSATNLYCVTTDLYTDKAQVTVHIGFDSYDMTVIEHGDDQ